MAQEPLAGLYVPQRPLSEAIFCVLDDDDAAVYITRLMAGTTP
jgi:hypothetical protein